MATETVQELRLLLRKKFPQAHLSQGGGAEFQERRLDFSDPETFPVGAISEIIPAGSEPILGLLFAELLGEPETANDLPDFVLVDGDGFDPGSFTNPACSRLLWVRCSAAMELLKAADLLIRDGNIPFILLDACRFSERELRALPASAWWRLKQMTERAGCRLLVLSSFPLVPCATLRLSLSSGLSLDDFDRPRGELLPQLQAQSQRLRHAT